MEQDTFESKRKAEEIRATLGIETKKSRPIFGELDKSLEYVSGHDAETAVADLLEKSEEAEEVFIMQPKPGSVKPVLEKRRKKKLHRAYKFNPGLREAQSADMALLDYVCGVDVKPFMLQEEMDSLPEDEQHIFFVDIHYYSRHDMEVGTSTEHYENLENKHATHRYAKESLQEIYDLENKEQVKTLVLVVDTAVTDDMSMADVAKYALENNTDTVYLSKI